MLSKWFESSRLNTFLRNSRDGDAPKGLVRTLIGGVVAAVSGLFLSRLLGAVVQALIVRRLGVTLYGEYATLLISLSLFASLLGLGLDTWLLQEGGRDSANLAQRMREVLAIKVIAALGLLGLLAIIWSNRIVQGPAFVIGAFAIIFDSFAQTGYSALRTMRRNTLVAVFQTVTPLLLLSVLFALERAALSVLLLVSIQAACSVALTLVVLTRVWRIHSLATLTQLDLRYAVKKGWLFVAAEGLSNIYTQSGPAILGAVVSTAAVGIYSPARNVILLTLLAPNLIVSVGLRLLKAPNTPPS
jgi:O-antigen/teichoic acid export membrane protein